MRGHVDDRARPAGGKEAAHGDGAAGHGEAEVERDQLEHLLCRRLVQRGVAEDRGVVHPAGQRSGRLGRVGGTLGGVLVAGVADHRRHALVPARSRPARRRRGRARRRGRPVASRSTSARPMPCAPPVTTYEPVMPRKRTTARAVRIPVAASTPEEEGDMIGRTALTVALVILAAAGPASAAPPADLNDDGNGKRWRQLAETVGMTPGPGGGHVPARRRDALLGRPQRLDLGDRRPGQGGHGPLRAGDPDRRSALGRRPGVPDVGDGVHHRHADDVHRHGLQLPHLGDLRLHVVSRRGRAAGPRQCRLRLVPDRRRASRSAPPRASTWACGCGGR